jgi:hypothetical protein
MGEQFVHTEDNEVEYYEARMQAGKTKWVKEPPLLLNKVENIDPDIMISTLVPYALVI